MKRILFTTLLAATAYAAGQGGIEGTIVDQMTGKVVTAPVTVEVQCGAVKKSTTTDAAGHFAIAGLPEGACTLTTGGGTYASASIGISIANGSIGTTLINVYTRAYLKQLEEERAKQEADWRKRSRSMHGGHVHATGRGVGGGGGGMAPRAMKKPAEVDFDDVAMPAGAMEGADEAPMAKREAPRPMPMHAPAAAPPPPAAATPPKPAPGKVATTPVVVAKAPAVQQQAPAQKVGAKDAEKAKLDVARGPVGNRRAIAAHVGVAGGEVGGWAAVRIFPVPQYTKHYEGPRDDFRETIYWNPVVETDASGNADVSFVASDAITAFRATAEGFTFDGNAGGGSMTFQSKLPASLDAHLPVEVTSGDKVEVPITITNETDVALDAKLDAKFGAAFKLASAPNGAIHLPAHGKQSIVYPLEVVATDGSADVDLRLATGGLDDELKKTIRVVPKGFPMEGGASGTAHGGQTARHTIDLAGALPGSIKATLTMYPSPIAAMTKGMEAMIREPGGCFEQTSSSNYPNVMVLAYMEENKAAEPELVKSTQTKLERGYKILTGYETSEKGYEWFGHTPGHEALTAYGLMEFADMSKVYDVDKSMVERTAAWLMTRRDGAGGFMRSKEALDSFGRANEKTTNEYIMWALAEAHRADGMSKELGAQLALGRDTKDPYLLALATNTAVLTKSGDAASLAKRLAAMQGKDGGFPGAEQTITMSGGESLEIETTALAELALIKASPNSEYEPQIRAAADWLNSKRSGYGQWGNTQATILGLKALTAYTEHARTMQASGTASVIVDGKPAGSISFDKGRRDAIVFDDLGKYLSAGKHTIEVKLDGPSSLPYTVNIEYRSAMPATSPRAKIGVTTELLKTSAKMGDGVTLRAHVENKTQDGVPMTLARIGLPGGTVFQTWQLKELRDKGLVDFYETRPREVILYWRALPPGAKKDIDINLLAAVPGTYEAPASSAYLYYTAEDKTWVKPVAITIAQ